MGFPKKASNRLRAAKSARKLSADFTNRRESGRQTAKLYEFPGVSRPAKLPAMRTADESAKPSAPPIIRSAGRAQSGRLVWNGYGGKAPRSADRARGKGSLPLVGKGKTAPRRRKRLAGTRLAFSSNGARLAPPLNKPKALQNKTPPN